MNTNKLKGKIIEKGLNTDTLCKKICMQKQTYYRKLNSNAFSVNDVINITKALDLTVQEMNSIFFDKLVAQMRI